MTGAFKHVNREAWLDAAAATIGQWLAQCGYPIAAHYRCACGFPSKGGASRKTIGQAWSPTCSAGKVAEVMISPVLAELVGSGERPSGVLPTLAHELVHVAVGTECGHKGPFRKACKALGLAGKMTATHAGPELAARLNVLAEDLGPYPHDALTPAVRGSKGSRLMLVECQCGIKARMSAKASAEAFAAGWTCGSCGERIGVEGDTESEDE